MCSSHGPRRLPQPESLPQCSARCRCDTGHVLLPERAQGKAKNGLFVSFLVLFFAAAFFSTFVIVRIYLDLSFVRLRGICEQFLFILEWRLSDHI